MSTAVAIEIPIFECPDTLIPTKGYKSKVIQQETTTTSTSTGRSGY